MSHQPVTRTHSTPTQLSDSSNRFRASLLEAAWIEKFAKVCLQHRKHGKCMEVTFPLPPVLARQEANPQVRHNPWIPWAASWPRNSGTFPGANHFPRGMAAVGGVFD